MKSKKFIIGLISLSLICVTSITNNATSYNPKTQAIDDYSLGFEIDDNFEFRCTVFNTKELNNVFGGDWSLNVGSFLWWNGYATPINVGNKIKFAITNITDHPSLIDWWEFMIDGWDWIDGSTSFGGVADHLDIAYSFPKNVSGETWNPSVWLTSLPVVLSLSEMSYSVGYSLIDNLLIYADSDVEDYYVNWLFNENTGVVKNFKIRNDINTTIFELNAPTLSKAGIPGYNLYTLISTIVLLTVFVSIISLKKIKWK